VLAYTVRCSGCQLAQPFLGDVSPDTLQSVGLASGSGLAAEIRQSLSGPASKLPVLGLRLFLLSVPSGGGGSRSVDFWAMTNRRAYGLGKGRGWDGEQGRVGGTRERREGWLRACMMRVPQEWTLVSGSALAT
jgi:hypothetical protein